MKAWMATTAALALLAGISTATAQNAPAAPSDKADTTMHQSAAPKAKASTKKTSMHQSMRMRHRATRETTGAGGRNDPSIHQSAGDRDSRDFPKQH